MTNRRSGIPHACFGGPEDHLDKILSTTGERKVWTLEELAEGCEPRGRRGQGAMVFSGAL